MTGGLSKNFHGVGIGPLSKILAVKTQFPFPQTNSFSLHVTSKSNSTLLARCVQDNLQIDLMAISVHYDI